MKKTYINFFYFILLGIAYTETQAEELKQTPKIPLELLEFIADFSDTDGNWIDPIETSKILENAELSSKDLKETSE